MCNPLNNVEPKVKDKMNKKEIKNIKLARQCLIYVKKECRNLECNNKLCPLNKFWEKK